MTVNKELKELLLNHREHIESKVKENELDDVIYLMDSLSATFKYPTSDYDRTGCTPYDDEVTKTYELKEYVNASFVPTSNTLFIAAQNPKDSKREIFLDLLMKSNTKLIISLINNPKYFEEEWLKNRTVIQYMGKDLFIDEVYNIRGENIRRLRYINWIDFSIITPEEMEIFHSYFNNIRTNSILIHCIAGVGRTGTFIMYDILKNMENITLESFVDVFINLRIKRAHLVTNEIQLGFLKNIFLKNQNLDSI